MSMTKQPLFSPQMKWFMAAVVLANIASTMSTILMPIYLTEMGADISQVGLVFSLTSAGSLATQVFGGWLSDSIGRLRTIAFGSIGGVLGFAAVLLAPSWQWLLAALMIKEIPAALVGPSFTAFIAENSTIENRGKVYGLTYSILQITGVLGPLIGGYLADAYGFKFMLGVGAALYAIAAGVRVRMAASVRGRGEKPANLSFTSFKNGMASMVRLLLAGGVITWIFVVDGISDIAFRLSGELQPLYMKTMGGVSVAQLGWLGSLNAAATILVPWLSGKLADRHGERLPIFSGFLMLFWAYAIFLGADTFTAFALSWIVLGVGGGLLGPAFQSLVSKKVPPHLLGTLTGVFAGSQGVIALPAPWLGAQLWERFSPRLPFAITAMATLVVLPPIWFKFDALGRAARNRHNADHASEEYPSVSDGSSSGVDTHTEGSLPAVPVSGHESRGDAHYAMEGR